MNEEGDDALLRYEGGGEAHQAARVERDQGRRDSPAHLCTK